MSAENGFFGGNWWLSFIRKSESPRRWIFILVALLMIAALGICDYFAGFEISMQLFYIVPVCLATMFGSWRWGIGLSILSVLVASVGDVMAGARFTSAMIPWANAIFAMGMYSAIVCLLYTVVTQQRELEQRVRQRTLALEQTLAERKQLELAILKISERERQSIGHDLHDGLGQHLTGTALAGQFIVEELRAQQLPHEAEKVQKLVELVEEGIEKSRRLAKGLLLAEIQPDNLLSAFEELAADVSREFRVICEFRSEGAGRVHDTITATHLFHIATEAVRNGVRHGKARRVEISFSANDDAGQRLSVSDNGSGLPAVGMRPRGLGLRIMAHRAEIIGWSFEIEPRSGGGTVVLCAQTSLAS